MIDFDWVPPGEDLPSDVEAELREMLRDAAEADAEAGFPQLSLDDDTEPGTTRLLVWLLPDDRSGRTVPLAPSLAGYLRIEPLSGEDAGTAEVSHVVRPEYRSRGITTLLLEKIGLELGSDEGWCGTGATALRVWARGNHPAALRMSLRFRRYGITTAARRWQLVLPLRVGREIDPGAEPRTIAVREAQGAAERRAAADLWTASGRRHRPPADATLLVSGPEAALDGAVWIDPDSGEPTEWGAAGRLVALVTGNADRDHEEDPLVRALLVAGLERLRDAGVRAGMITMDARDRPLVHEARSLGLMHDQTDVLYTVRNRATEPLPAVR
ncbi:GNAT family N-acetyltransferase [Pseudonocardia sp. WMMC193]|uniref:GNAT family N-acetyltransferase n=1 Tax=Pseudonocardia sp. WMMC193 TaxID=2911965 RepID=UPI001F00CB84|nr:GNAT family N-acetyltransferase [Pseudonocardia sp. WMMC193]MCF7549521.1 GNAT family N-acetyltransferase [Pseudonocardia sp. WMMC193]